MTRSIAAYFRRSIGLGRTIRYSRDSPNQALEQTRDSVLRYGEPIGRELLNLVVIRLK